MSVVVVHQEICHYCSTLKKQVPKFNKLAEDLVQILRGVADGRTWFDLRDHYRNTTLHAISLVCLTLSVLSIHSMSSLEVAFGGDLSQDPFVSSLLAPRGGLLATLDNSLHGVEKVLRNPLQKVLQDYSCGDKVMHHALTPFTVCAIW